MKIGAHISASGGIDKVIDRAKLIGAEAVQIFGSPPQAWAFKAPAVDVIKSFKDQAKDAGIDAVVLHAVYLINLGTANPDNLEKGIKSLINYMELSESIGAQGVIFHGGSHKGLGYDSIFKQIVDSVEKVLDSSPGKSWLAIENSAGMGNHIGSKFKEIGTIMESLGSKRFKVCLDTQHTFAAGYDISDKTLIDVVMDEFNEVVGIDNLVAVHANDSKVPFASGVDRHENIGEGHIGEEGFRAIIGHSAFSDIPFFLEVPGFEKNGPDKKNIDRLKSIRSMLKISK